MHSILKSWQEKGLKTLAAIREGDGAKAPQQTKEKKRVVSDFEREALRKLMEEEG